MKKTIYFIIINILWIAQSAFAVCDQERSRRNEAKEVCDHLSQASTAGSLVLGAIVASFSGKAAAVTGPATVVGTGATLGTIAKRQCEIYEEREKALTECMEYQINLAKEKEAEKEKRLERLIPRKKIKDRYRILGEQYDAEHLKKLEELFENEIIGLGKKVYDPKFIEKTKALDDEYYQLSKQLEADMNKELAQYQCDEILEMEENQ